MSLHGGRATTGAVVEWSPLFNGAKKRRGGSDVEVGVSQSDLPCLEKKGD